MNCEDGLVGERGEQGMGDGGRRGRQGNKNSDGRIQTIEEPCRGQLQSGHKKQRGKEHRRGKDLTGRM